MNRRAFLGGVIASAAAAAGLASRPAPALACDLVVRLPQLQIVTGAQIWESCIMNAHIVDLAAEAIQRGEFDAEAGR